MPTTGSGQHMLNAADPLRDALVAALGAQYELLGLIGRGGMGAVYQAREHFLDRLVAVKVLPAEAASSPDARERFLREARTAARLTHPHIVPLYTFGQAGDTLFYVMGYVDGESLEARLRREGRLPPDEAARILADLADALDYAHRSGVVHRDLKPDNVLIDRETGRALLADFGIAKAGADGSTLTQTGMIVGTPHYMSPEQASGERTLDGRSDLYSLGVIGYRMLSGRLPFEGANLRDVLAQHLTAPPAPFGPDVPPAIAEVVMRALGKAPDDRWRDARAMRAALGSDEDEALPDDLHEIVGVGAGTSILGLCIAEVGFLGGVSGFLHPGGAVAMAGVGLLILPLALSAALATRARKHGWRRVVSLVLRQPAWWPGPWPRIGRRTGDVWDRLPAPIRHLRIMNVFGMIPAALSLNALVVLSQERYILWMEKGAWPFVVAALGVVAGIAVFSVRARNWARAHGLTGRETKRFATEPTFALQFWGRPEIAALLGAAPRVLSSGTRTPAEQLRAMEDAVRVLPHASDVVRDAVEAAREAVSAIAVCEAELAQLDRDASPEDRARIEGALAALGVAESDERDAKRRMRELLGGQMALVQSLDARRREVTDRRARLAGQLQALCLQVAALRAAAVRDVADAELTGRIRALRRDLAHEASAADEVKQLAPG